MSELQFTTLMVGIGLICLIQFVGLALIAISLRVIEKTLEFQYRELQSIGRCINTVNQNLDPIQRVAEKNLRGW